MMLANFTDISGTGEPLRPAGAETSGRRRLRGLRSNDISAV